MDFISSTKKYLDRGIQIASASPAKIYSILAATLIAFIIFWGGMAVGYHKAMFSYTWHSQYAEQFAGKQSPFMIPTDGDADTMPNPHGAFGIVVSVALPFIVVKGPLEAEKSILITNNTIVRDMHDVSASTSLANGQSVIVMGWPDQQGHVVASFVRILPQPDQADKASSTATSSRPKY